MHYIFWLIFCQIYFFLSGVGAYIAMEGDVLAILAGVGFFAVGVLSSQIRATIFRYRKSRIRRTFFCRYSSCTGDLLQYKIDCALVRRHLSLSLNYRKVFISLEADVNALPFYLKVGGLHVGNQPSFSSLFL